MQGFTVQVDNVSSRATTRDLHDFFSFSGRILRIDLSPRDSHSNRSQVALVTFKDKDALETALILSGSIIVDQAVNIVSLQQAMDQEFGWPQEHNTIVVDALGNPSNNASMSRPVVTRAQDIVASMLSKGHILGKDVVSRARSFDAKHQQLGVNTALNSDGALLCQPEKPSNSTTIGLSGRLNVGASIIQSTAQSINERFHIAEGTMSVYSFAHQGIKSAGTTIVNNKIVQSGSLWVSGAFYKVAQVAGSVTRFKDKYHSSELPKVSRARA